MKILMIGGTGFLGSRIVDHLAADHQIAVFHQGKTKSALPKGVKTIHGNRLELEKFKDEISSFAPEVVLDVIASTQKQAVDLLNVCKGIAKRIIAISSCDVYKAYDIFLGRSLGYIPSPFKETSPLRDQFYLLKNIDPALLPSWLGPDYEKIHVEEVILNNPHMPGTIVRLPMVYGQGDIQNRFSEIIEWQKNDQNILLDAETANWRGCWGYVDNVVEAICLAITHEKAAGQIYHVADTTSLPYSKIIEQLGFASGWGGKIEISSDIYPPTNLKTIFKVPYIDPSQNLALDIGKISDELGYREILSKDEAFYHTYKWLTEK